MKWLQASRNPQRIVESQMRRMMPCLWLAGLPIENDLTFDNDVVNGDLDGVDGDDEDSKLLIFCWWWGWSDRWTHCNVHFVDDTVWRWSRNGWSVFMAVTFTLNIDHFRVKQKYFQLSAIEKTLGWKQVLFRLQGISLCVLFCHAVWDSVTRQNNKENGWVGFCNNIQNDNLGVYRKTSSCLITLNT